MTSLRPALAGVAIAALSACSALSPGASAGTERPTSESIEDAEALGLIPDLVSGPFETLDEYCKQVKDRGKCTGSERTIDEDLEAPYELVELIRVVPRRGGIEYCEIAIATAEGWWVTEELFICGESGADVEAEIINLELVFQKDTPPIVRAEMRVRVNEDGAAMQSESLVLCGVNDANEVSCTRPFSRLEHVLHADGKEEHRAVSLTLSRFGVIKVNGRALVDGEVQDVSGAYRIRFR